MTSGAEPLIRWPQPLLELSGFLAVFLTAGAIGFRFVVLRELRRSAPTAEADVAAHAAARAVGFGLAGALLSMVRYAPNLAGFAARHHLSIPDLIASDLQVQIQIGARLLMLTGFAAAAARRVSGWWLALAGVLGVTLEPVAFLQWTRTVNPMHSFAGGLWLGTLFLVLAAGLPAANAALPERREHLTARMIHAFSPLALASAPVLALFGVITAWRHLKRLNALWSTPYGITLIIKLVVVAAVVALGAWNWKRVKPRLGAEGGATILRSTARAELIVAAVVLLITAVLVSLPSP